MHHNPSKRIIAFHARYLSLGQSFNFTGRRRTRQLMWWVLQSVNNWCSGGMLWLQDRTWLDCLPSSVHMERVTLCQHFPRKSGQLRQPLHIEYAIEQHSEFFCCVSCFVLVCNPGEVAKFLFAIRVCQVYLSSFIIKSKKEVVDNRMISTITHN